VSRPVIRPEAPEDAAAIRLLTTAAFRGAPHSSGTEAAIVDRLREAGALTLSLVASERGAVVGHVAFSPVALSGGEARWFALGPIAVHPARQHQGIGSALAREGLTRLRAAGAGGCVLLGDPAFYGRFGFINDPRLACGNIPPPFLQRLSFDGAEPVGEVRFHPAFGGTG
jgi:putative acetyltransferase